MTRSILISCSLLSTLFVGSLLGQSLPIDSLLGSWKVDLRPNPEAPAYTQYLEIQGISRGNIKGLFYGSPMQEGLINQLWPRPYLAWQTNDRSHTYYHSAYWEASTLHGLSYCPGRQLIMPWTAIRNH